MCVGSCARHWGGGNKQESLWCLVGEAGLLSLPESSRILAETGCAKTQREGTWRASGMAIDLVKEENIKGL